MRSMVEGAPSPLKNPQDRRSGVAEGFRRGQVNHWESTAKQEILTTRIALRCLGGIMRKSVDFDDQAGFAAVKVDDIGFNRVPAAEHQPIRPLSQLLPRQHFGETHLLPEAPCGVDGRTLERRPAPSTALRAVPLPVPGRIWCDCPHASPSRVSSRRSRRA